MGNEKSVFKKRAVELAAMKLYHDFTSYQGMEPEHFYERWEKSCLVKVDNMFRKGVFRVFLALLKERAKNG